MILCKNLNIILYRCYFKLGQWQQANQSAVDSPSSPQVINMYRMASDCDRNWYKAWHALAGSYFDAVLYYKQQAARSVAEVLNHSSSAPIANSMNGDGTLGDLSVSSIDTNLPQSAHSPVQGQRAVVRILP